MIFGLFFFRPTSAKHEISVFDGLTQKKVREIQCHTLHSSIGAEFAEVQLFEIQNTQKFFMIKDRFFLFLKFLFCTSRHGFSWYITIKRVESLKLYGKSRKLKSTVMFFRLVIGFLSFFGAYEQNSQVTHRAKLCLNLEI